MECILETSLGIDNLAIELSNFGCYLNGETAIDVWCYNFGIKKTNRKSKPDVIEFYNPSTNGSNNNNIEKILKNEEFRVESGPNAIFGFSDDKIGIDIMVGYERNRKLFTSIKNLNIVHPVYLLIKKLEKHLLCRKWGETTDDISVLITIVDKMNELDFLEREIVNRPVTFFDMKPIISLLGSFDRNPRIKELRLNLSKSI